MAGRDYDFATERYEPRSEGNPKLGLEFHLKKERKIDRIKELLMSCGYEYRENYKADGSVSIRVWGKEIVEECEKHLTNKCFDWQWISMSRRQSELFLDEILFWDGCRDANLYTSKQKINLDVVSAIAAINGVGSNVCGSNIQFRQNPFITLGREKGSTKRNNKQHGTIKTKVSCVSVKTGIFLVRQHGKTFITGNCPGDWLYSRLGDLAEKVTVELSETKKEEKKLQAADLAGLPNEEVISKVGSLFTADQKKTGVLASVSLAQFILESGYGKSELAQKANNCFGMKKSLSGNTWAGSTWDGKSTYTKKTKEQRSSGTVTVTAEFRKYPCIEDSIEDHSAYLTGAKKGNALRYPGLKGCTDHRKAAQIIKNGGYATSTTYVEKLCSIIEQWKLMQYDADAVPPEDEPATEVLFLVKVERPIDIKKSATTDSATSRKCPRGIFTIVEEKNGYGRLKSGAGWVKLSEVRKM